jgi:hypothetical protein
VHVQVEGLVNPPVNTIFKQRMEELKDMMYASKRRGPLGRSHDQSTAFPKGFGDPMQKQFGLAIIKDGSANELVSPSKTAAQVELESKDGKELYRISHKDYEVGEMIDRNYDWSRFKKNSLYGVPTPHDNTGGSVRKSLISNKDDGGMTSKQLDDFRERKHPQVGKVHDPIADTLRVSDDHTFGVTVLSDQYSAGDLLHTNGPSSYLSCTSPLNEGLLATIRRHLKINHFTNFDILRNAMEQVKETEKDIVDGDIVRDLMYQFHVPLHSEMIELLMAWCKEEGGVAYRDLIHLIDWRHQIPIELSEKMMNNGNIEDLNAESTDYKTSSGQVKATIGGIQTKDYRTFGVPTIRVDRPAPRIRRVSDRTNYGDESDVYGLIYPSIYSLYGLHEQDFFEPRPPEQIRMILEAAGISINDDAFESLWAKAAANDPCQQVCFESFRAVLENIQFKENKN